MARILIVGAGERGIWLAGALAQEGHATRVLTRSGARREAILRSGAECWIGTADRLGTLLGALENVTIACWLLGCARGSTEQVEALHDMRLRSFMVKAIDTTIRGVLYEAAGTLPERVLRHGGAVASEVAERNQIPLRLLHANPADGERWRPAALAAVRSLLSAA